MRVDLLDKLFVRCQDHHELSPEEMASLAGRLLEAAWSEDDGPLEALVDELARETAVDMAERLPGIIG